MSLQKKISLLLLLLIGLMAYCVNTHLDEFLPSNEIIVAVDEDKNDDLLNNLIKNDITIKNNNPLPTDKKEESEVKSDEQVETTVSEDFVVPEGEIIEVIEQKPEVVTEVEEKQETQEKIELIKEQTLQEQINAIVKENKITFKRLSTEVSEKSIPTIEKIAQILKDNPEITIEVGGHTDAKGKDDVNAYISKHRALSVKKVLVNMGIDKSRLTAKGYGESMPIVANDPQGYSMENRRVEFKIIKGTEE